MRVRVIALLMALTMMIGQTAKAQTVNDSLEIGLLTCSPGTKAYSLYGHTALRVHDFERELDIVFNYGVFDFRKPHFVWRFVLGQCDYQVAAYPYSAFISEYEERGSSVIQQTLALSKEEKHRLYQNLVMNAMPENKTYRYNFLTNNCTTKARDMIEGAVEGKVVYKEDSDHVTYRQLLHRYTKDYPWSETGNDMLLGAACDTVLTDRAAQFLPDQLMDYLATAEIYDEQNNRRPLVGETVMLLLANEEKARLATEEDFPLSPLLLGVSLLILLLLIALIEHAWGKMFWGIDILLMTAQGVAGILICFMFFFSEHPTVDSNWQTVVFNPIPLFAIPWVVKCARQHKTCLYHYINVFWLVLFLVFCLWIPQDFPLLTILLALCLLTRPVSYLTNVEKKENEKR